MKTGTLIAIVLLAVASVAGAVWVFQGKTPDVVTSPKEGSDKSEGSKTAVVDDSDPNNPCPPLYPAGSKQPKVEVPMKEYKFGNMEAFQEKSWTFEIKNVGEADL